MDNHDVAKSIARKLEARKLANTYKGTVKEAAGQHRHRLYDTAAVMYEINAALSEADDVKYQDMYSSITAKRKVIGPIVVFIKKAVRRVINAALGWYIYPLVNRQARFNEKTLQAAELMSALVAEANEDNGRAVNCVKQEQYEALALRLSEAEKAVAQYKAGQDQAFLQQNEMAAALDRLTAENEQLKAKVNALFK